MARSCPCSCYGLGSIVVSTTTLPGGGREGHDAKCEIEAARLDDDGGVEPVDRWVVREPGSRERLHGAAEVVMVADGEREEVVSAAGVLLLVVGVPRGRAFWVVLLHSRDAAEASRRMSLPV